MTQPTNSIEVITRYEKGKETKYSIDGGKTYMTKTEFEARRADTSAKDNSIDSELSTMPQIWTTILSSELPGWSLKEGGSPALTLVDTKTILIDRSEWHRNGLFLHELAHAKCFEAGDHPHGNKHHSGHAYMLDTLVDKYMDWKPATLAAEQPIDSELEEILDQLCIEAVAEYDWRELHIKKALQAIKSLYISRKEVEEAIGEPKLGDFDIKPESYDDVVKAIKWYKDRIAKLLPPAKGGNDE